MDPGDSLLKALAAERVEAELERRIG